ncbi:MAG TPA: acyl-CoA dehydrogenase family protein, partial [Nitrososphaerales archaeon]|nr:acyl-CoA dehydrogenase family protein [Nitrososphaerales archaeon]
PTAKQIDMSGTFPRENMDKIFAQGFTNIPYPESLGGLGLPYPMYVACMELVAKACASTAISLAIHGTVCDGIFRFGNSDQHEKYLRPLITGRKLAAFALTEPGAGSDARAMTTTAELRGGEWHINGSKMYITNTGKADYYFVFAKTAKGHASIMVPKDVVGFSFGANISKMGLRGSTLMGLNFDDVSVPEENLIGKNGEGFEYAKKMLLAGRITIAALSVGIAQIALEKTVAYSNERKAFGHVLADFEITRSKIADMKTQIDASRLSTYYAGYRKSLKEDYSVEACEAKLFATEMALNACNEAIQIHGGYGYTDEADVHRHWRDAKLMTIGEGTSEIMKIIISNSALGQD